MSMIEVRNEMDGEDECKHELDEHIAELTSLQLKHYLINMEDVRNCPNQTCDYSGFMDVDIRTQ